MEPITLGISVAAAVGACATFVTGLVSGFQHEDVKPLLKHWAACAVLAGLSMGASEYTHPHPSQPTTAPTAQISSVPGHG